MTRARQLYCSFCGKAQHEVFYLVSGPNVFICDECIRQAQEIITEKRLEGGTPAAALISE